MNIDNNNNNAAAPTAGETPWYKKVKQVLTVVSQVILTAPVKLPPKIRAGAQYVAILLGILESLERASPTEEATPEGASMPEEALRKEEADDD